MGLEEYLGAVKAKGQLRRRNFELYKLHDGPDLANILKVTDN
jgi:hypothetical protein